ncbi:hypothetical protein GSI_02670 [Ganoderma sinense ZZ0214-1]|uniref:F-box domain-containing protein n=1 Tax=Ganoderma sinense ZZ0214-1 TaxID=1077348 RepID=A0A2G8SMC0_9APHY|nr:hypothetical protein GSI_02670 [Ganoderma sinense ZZ0214-1]
MSDSSCIVEKLRYGDTEQWAPFNRLPPELLHMVFKAAATYTLPEVVEHFDWRCVLTLTHVCPLWRTMVVAESHLWSHVNMKSGLRLAQLFTQRSLSLPLVIYASLDELALLDMVLDNHGSRAAAIHVTHECERPEQKSVSLLDRFSWSLPRLECFVLRAFINWQPEDAPYEWHLFADEISPLRALRLEGISLWACIPINPLPNLTHLLLLPTSYDEHFLLLKMLSSSPRLQYLHFIGLILDISDPRFNAPFPIVSLLHIRILSFHVSDLEIVLFLLRNFRLPAECALCINGASSRLDFSDPSTFPFPNALDLPPLRVLDAATSMDLSVWFDGFLVAEHNAPRFSAGFFLEACGCYGHWVWLAERLPATLPLANITILHVSIDDEDRLTQVLPSLLKHFTRLRELCFLLSPVPPDMVPRAHDDRTLVELFLGALLPGPTAAIGLADSTVVCPELRVLGLEAQLAHDDFPFPAVEYTAAARKDAGYPLARFVYHPHTRKHDATEMRARFVASFAPLTALVDVVEYRRARDVDVRVCPFRSPSGGCWDMAEAERYWKLPGRLMSYGRDDFEDWDSWPEEEGDDGEVEQEEDNAIVLIFAWTADTDNANNQSGPLAHACARGAPESSEEHPLADVVDAELIR